MSYGKVKESFWTDKKVRGFSDDAKMLALYLMTGPHRNILGCMRVPNGYLMEDLGWSSERLSDAIAMLCGCHFICRDDDGWTLILNQLRHDPIKVKNHAVAAIRLAEDVPRESVVYQQLVPRLKEALDGIGMASEWHPDAIPDGIAIPEPAPAPAPAPAPSPEPEPEPDDGSANGSQSPEGGSTPPPPAGGAAARGAYAFRGQVVRLKPDDLERWRTSYHAVPDLLAELNRIDEWLRDKPDKQAKWFPLASGWLNKIHQQRTAEAAALARDDYAHDPLVQEALAWGREDAEPVH